MPKVKRSIKRKNPALLDDRTFRVLYPDAYKIFCAFDKAMIQFGYVHTGKFRGLSKVAAVRIVNELPHINRKDFNRCILWCFSQDKKSLDFYGRMPVNHLGTVLTLYNVWIDRKRIFTGADSTTLRGQTLRQRRTDSKRIKA